MKVQAERELEARIKHGYADVNGVLLHYVEGGEGPLVLLLHGFPDFWYTWRNQIPALIDAGYRVVAPDLRGYNESSKPSGISSYRIEELCADVDGLIEHFGEEKILLAGHDWGGNVSWFFAMRYPHRVRRLAVLNMPHPQRMLEGMRTLRQLRKSWYIFFFQLPNLPEWMMRAGGFSMLRGLLRSEPNEPFTEEELQHYVKAFEGPRTIESAIHYYRAIMRYPSELKKSDMQIVMAPVLVLFGDRDPHLSKELARPSAELVPNVEVHHYPQAAHWVQHDEAEEVSRRLTDFFGKAAEDSYAPGTGEPLLHNQL
ncbi:alpha/beta fold hydrolase [Saccharibacillus kuerlensis]|uniref:Epoxide hydrolase n=1 Tax=Saccharibacillus kuerlensis TaxID=459527 RepID=A0ABQ2L5A9_9BACL|nr:alpha/beta hydrolase [Saccharibacillus kuerlensis]GGO00478.1 epoxide hydrolase [Saccharibacillus kuerlensis]